MAAAGGRKSAGLRERLLREPYRFDFFQAVRLLERLAREPAAGGAEREAVRFRALPSLAFPASAVSAVKLLRGDPTAAAEMVVSFLGLIGANGALPHHYTALLLHRVRDKDFSLRDWLDVFQNRMTAHFYRSWQKYRLPFAFERFRAGEAARPAPEHNGRVPRQDDPVTWGLYCAVGLGTGGLQDRLTVPDPAFIHYGGLFGQTRRNVVSLEVMLIDYFGVPVEIESFRGQWLELGEANLARMGGPKRGRNNLVGRDLIVGRRVWDVQSKFRLRVGPLSYAEFCRLMPDGDMLRPLCEMARTYAGPELDLDVQPILKAAEVPRCQLGGGRRPRLGWNTWIRTRPMARDAGEAVFRLPGL